MAVILVLAGGALGFVLGILSYALLNLGLLAALAVWSGTGILFLAAGLAASAFPGNPSPRHRPHAA
ncbi:MAG: hypothetical protein QM656_13105 [Paracoccaceae bacterium]